MKIRILAIVIILLGALAGYFIYPKWGIWERVNIPFRLGLDLKGGIHLVYKADLSKIGNAEKALKLIGETPFLEFRREQEVAPVGTSTEPQIIFLPTELTGRYLASAQIQFEPTTNQPYVEIVFNDEGAKLFEQLTEQNVNKRIAVYLDGAPISIPVVREKISGGRALIT